MTPDAVKYRKSRIRLEILDYLQQTDTHPTAEEIYLEIRRNHPSASYATVYRNLNILVDQGEVKRIEFSRSKDRFDARLHFHAHFLCDACGALFDIPFDIEKRTRDIEVRTGHRMNNCSVEYHGICAACLRKS